MSKDNEKNWCINLGQAGYDSVFDGSILNFNITYKELMTMIKTLSLERQEKIFNSGSNTYLSPENWIRNEKGELTDTEKRELGMSI